MINKKVKISILLSLVLVLFLMPLVSADKEATGVDMTSPTSNLTLNVTNNFTMICDPTIAGVGGPNDAIIISQYCDTLDCTGTVTNITVDDSPTGEVIAIATGGSGNPLTNNVNAVQTNTVVAHETGTVYIRCKVIDLESGACTGDGCVSGDTWEITVEDIVAPTIALNNPVNDSWENSTNVTFYFTPNDASSEIANCSLIINGAYNQSNTSAVIEGQENNITTTLSEGTYNWTVNCTDTATTPNTGTNTSEKIINVDTTAPYNITLNLPVNNTNVSSQNLTFNFTAYDNLDTTLNCSLYLNGTLNQTNSSVNNGTLTDFIVNNIAEGNHEWNISCADSANNVNWSTETRIFTVDITAPALSSILYSPNSTGDLDPNANITFNATVIDAGVGIDTVILQYHNGADWANTTMSNNSATNYNVTITLISTEANYTFSVWANDTIGNVNQTTNQTFESAWDCTWQATSELGETAGWDENKEIGNITINNTGDSQYSLSSCSLDFRLTHSLTEGRIYFDNDYIMPSDTYTIAAKGQQNITINASFLSEVKQEIVTISIDEFRERSATAQRNTTTTLVSNQEGPYLYQKLTSSPTSLSLTPVNFSLQGYIRNLMGSATVNPNNTAYNVSFYWTLPSGFTNATGNLTQNFTNITDNNLHYNNIEATFSDLASMTSGTKTFYLYAQGYNLSGDLIENADNLTLLTESANITFSCYSVSDGVYVTACGTLDGDYTEPEEEPTPGPGAGGGGGGGAVIPKVSILRITKAELLESEEAFELVRGENNSFPIKITNPYAELEMTNILIEVEGYLSQYLNISPTYFPKIKPNETRTFIATITSPSYMTRGEHELTFTLKGKLYGEKTTQLTETSSVTTKYDQEFEEIRTVLLTIFEVSPEDAGGYLEQAKKDWEKMVEAGFPNEKIPPLLKEMNKFLAEKNYEQVKELGEEIRKIRKDAFAADKLIQEVEAQLAQAKEKWLEVPKTKEAVQLALLAFERGDYELASQRAQDAQLLYLLETKGKINLLKFIADWWWALLLGLIVLSVLAYFTYKKSMIMLIGQRLKNLNKEEETIQELLAETQKRYLQEKTLSEPQFKRYTAQYEKRLTKIRQLRVKLRNKRVAILKTEQELKNIKKEKEEVQELLKQNQMEYLVKGKLSKKKFEDIHEQNQTRLTEIEQEESLLEERLEKEKGTRKYWVFGFIQKIFGLFEKKQPEGTKKKEAKKPKEAGETKKKKRAAKKKTKPGKKKATKKPAARKKPGKKKEITKKAGEKVKEQRIDETEQEQTPEAPLFKEEIKEEEKPSEKKEEPLLPEARAGEEAAKEFHQTTPATLSEEELKELKQEAVNRAALMKMFDNPKIVPDLPQVKKYYFDHEKKTLVPLSEREGSLKPSTADEYKNMLGNVLTKDFTKTEKTPLSTKLEFTIKKVPQQKRIINLPKNKQEAKPMSINELKKWFPGAFK